jgi:hypothetical protein
VAVGRVYTAEINISTAFTAQIDVFEVLAASGKPFRVLGFELGQVSEIADAQEEGLNLVLKRITASPTSGSGGGTSTFLPVTPNDTAAGATIETGNTTKLSGGTSVNLKRFAWNIRGPLPYTPIPESLITIDAATRLVLELTTTPADSISGIFGWIEIEELV